MQSPLRHAIENSLQCPDSAVQLYGDRVSKLSRKPFTLILGVEDGHQILAQLITK
jgi:hypothetical protein